MLESLYVETVGHRCSSKQVFLKILQNSQKITSSRDSFLYKVAEDTQENLLCRIFPVAASAYISCNIDYPLNFVQMLKISLILTKFFASKTIPYIEIVFQDQSKNYYASEQSISVVKATSNTTVSKYFFGTASITVTYVHYERLLYSLQQSNFIQRD